MKNVYQKLGFRNREQYLKTLSEDFEIPEEIVFELASVLGENEDFDGLVTTLEDYPYKGFE